MTASSSAPMGRDDASRVVGRSNTQNNEASLIGGVAGLAQFLGTGAAAGSYLASADAAQASGATVDAPGLGNGNGLIGTAGAGNVARHDLPAAGNGSAGPTPIASGHDGSEAGTSSGGPAGTAPQQSGSPVAGAVDIGPLNGGQGANDAGSPQSGAAVAPTAAGTVSAPQPASPVDAGPQPSPMMSTMPITADFADFMQSNVSISDHDATSISTAITYIHSITNSIVFLGDNVAFANALNIAPVTQLNQFIGGGSGGSGGSGAGQMSNAAITDNDATAVAVAATIVNHAYNSIIVTGSSIANATAINLSPVTQLNKTLFSNLDKPSFGSLDQMNLAITDNDSTALAQAGLLIGNASAAMPPAEMALSGSHPPNFDAIESQPLWSDFEPV